MAVTVTYNYPVSGVVPPAAPNNNANAVTGTVIADADADVTAVITHNMGLMPAQLAALSPWIRLIPLQAKAFVSLWFLAAFDANTVTLTKANAMGSGDAAPQIQFVIERPQSSVT
jgi:hypothetical protein